MKRKIISFIIIGFIILMSSTVIFAIDTSDYEPISPKDYDEFTDIGSNFISIIQFVGIIFAVIVLTLMGIKYILGSAEEKAEYKKNMMPYVIGCVFIMCSSAFVGIIGNNIYESTKTITYDSDVGTVTVDGTEVTVDKKVTIRGQEVNAGAQIHMSGEGEYFYIKVVCMNCGNIEKLQGEKLRTLVDESIEKYEEKTVIQITCSACGEPIKRVNVPHEFLEVDYYYVHFIKNDIRYRIRSEWIANLIPDESNYYIREVWCTNYHTFKVDFNNYTETFNLACPECDASTTVNVIKAEEFDALSLDGSYKYKVTVFPEFERKIEINDKEAKFTCANGHTNTMDLSSYEDEWDYGYLAIDICCPSCNDEIADVSMYDQNYTPKPKEEEPEEEPEEKEISIQSNDGLLSFTFENTTYGIMEMNDKTFTYGCTSCKNSNTIEFKYEEFRKEFTNNQDIFCPDCNKRLGRLGVSCVTNTERYESNDGKKIYEVGTNVGDEVEVNVEDEILTYKCECGYVGDHDLSNLKKALYDGFIIDCANCGLVGICRGYLAEIKE